MSCIARTSSQVHRFASLSRFTYTIISSNLRSALFSLAPTPLPALSPARHHICAPTRTYTYINPYRHPDLQGPEPRHPPPDT